MEGLDGAWLASATNAELSELDGLGSPPLRKALRNRVNSRDKGTSTSAPAPAPMRPRAQVTDTAVPPESKAEVTANQLVGRVEKAHEVRTGEQMLKVCFNTSTCQYQTSFVDWACHPLDDLSIFAMPTAF